MGVRIKFDTFHNIEEPTLILATRKGRKLGSLPAQSIVFKDCLNDYSELSFRVYKYDNGEECRLWKQIQDFKLVYCKEWDLWFEIRVEIDEKNDIVKNIMGRSLAEAELSQVMLYNIEINTETDISREDYEKPTVFYDAEYPENSLLDRITEKVPHYTIAHVDVTLAKIQKTFTFDDTSLYDAFQDIAEEIGCIFILNSGSDENGNIKREISVYDLNTNCNLCGHRGEYTNVCPKCGESDLNYGYGEDTHIFISSEKLADNITYSVDTDSVKNCFKLEGGDDLMNATIRNCNPNGSDYLWHISDEVKEDMSKELVERLNSYDELYRQYQDDYRITFDTEDMSGALDEFNKLVGKYTKYNDKLETIQSPIIGFPELMNAYYNTIDLAVFLQSGLMPSPEMSETTAQAQANLLTRTNLSPVSVTSLNTISEATAANAVLLMARILVKSGYQVKVNDSSLSGHTWTGNFKITSYEDEDDTATSRTISVEINKDFDNYLKQKVKKALSESDLDDMGIVNLFSKDSSDFENELKRYCLDSLMIFNNACQAALDIMMEYEIADKKKDKTDETDKYETLYLPYYQKMKAIQAEVSVRESEINAIVGVYDRYGDLRTYGLQNYIIDARDSIQAKLDFQKHLGEYWEEFCAYRREDKYSNSNYISDGLNNAELFQRALEFIEAASNEIYKSAELQHSISGELKNLLALEEFRPLVDNFEVGNWIRLRVDDDVYRLRLLEYEIDYDDLANVSVEFSDILKVVGGLSDIQSVIKQASSMASSYDSVAHQASQGAQGNKRVRDWVEKGLALTNSFISNSDNQEVVMDSHGFFVREWFPVTETYSDKQLRIINKGLYVTNDNWETARAGIGNFVYYDPDLKTEVESYGVIADTIIGKIILGERVGIYTRNSNIKLDENGFIITNDGVMTESGQKISDTPVTVKIDPNAEDYIVSMTSKNESNIKSNIFCITKNGKLILGDSDFVVDTDGSLSIGGNQFVFNSSTGKLSIGNGNFIVDKNGNITMTGSIHLQAGSVIDWTSGIDDNGALDKANDAYSYAGDAYDYADDAYNDVTDLVNGKYAKKSTFINKDTVFSPTIRGGYFVGAKFFAVDNVDASVSSSGDILGAKRLIMDSNGISAYDTSNRKNGVVISSSNFSYIHMYYAGDDRGFFGQEASYLRIHPEYRLVIGNSSPSTGKMGDVVGVGAWKFGVSASDNCSVDFSHATVYGLKITFG